MTRDQKIEKAADALIAEIKDFHCPAELYIAPEARLRWQKQNPDRTPLEFQPIEDWERDSYRLLAATVIDAIEGLSARIVK